MGTTSLKVLLRCDKRLLLKLMSDTNFLPQTISIVTKGYALSAGRQIVYSFSNIQGYNTCAQKNVG